jgi:transposase-like protein
MKRKTYTDEFKREVIARVKAGERTSAVAGDLKLRPNLISSWMKQLGGKKKAVNKLSNVHGAIVYLRHARTAAVVQITQDPNRWDDPVYQFAMMALRALEGK